MGKNKKTHEEYVEELKVKNPNIEVIGDYIGSRTKIIHRCKIDGFEWGIMPTNALKGYGCPKCNKNYHKTNDDYVNELKIKNPNVISLEQYINGQSKILHKCLIHDYEWYVSPNAILKTTGCPKCNNKYKKTTEDYIAELEAINPNIEVLGTYVNAKTKISHRCKKHNIIWMTCPSNTLKGEGCKQCANDALSLKRLKSNSEYIDELSLKNPTVEVLEEYKGGNIKILHRCKIHNMEFMKTPTLALLGRSCELCTHERLSIVNRKSHEDYIDELKIVNPNIIAMEDYVNSRTKILHKCLNHDYEWYATPTSVLSGHGCKKCQIEKLSLCHIKTHEKYVSDLKTSNPNVMVVEEYKGSNIKILHKCIIHNHEWKSSPASVLQGFGCPMCNISIGENKVKEWLDNQGFIYEQQKRFADCADKYSLPFDFYLPKLDICIEYDGKQHYHPVSFGCKDINVVNKNFETTKKHDRIKTEYCKSKGIRLIRIPYFDDVKEKLDLLLT